MLVDIKTYIPKRLRDFKVQFPNVENTHSMLAYLESHNVEIDRSNLLVFSSLSAYTYAYRKRFFVFPKAAFYTRSGVFITLLDNPDEFNGLDNLPIYKVRDSNKAIHNFYTYIDKTCFKSFSKKSIKVIITWAIYAGDINKDFAFRWMELLEKEKQIGFDMEYYLLNCDLQANWDYSSN